MSDNNDCTLNVHSDEELSSISSITLLPTLKEYKILWDNIKSIEDVKQLIKAFDIKFYLADENAKLVKDLVTLVD